MKPLIVRESGEDLREFAYRAFDRTATEHAFRNVMSLNRIPCCILPARFSTGSSRVAFARLLEEQCSKFGEPKDYYMYWSPIDVAIYFNTEEAAALFKLSHSSV